MQKSILRRIAGLTSIVLMAIVVSHPQNRIIYEGDYPKLTFTVLAVWFAFSLINKILMGLNLSSKEVAVISLLLWLAAIVMIGTGSSLTRPFIAVALACWPGVDLCDLITQRRS